MSPSMVMPISAEAKIVWGKVEKKLFLGQLQQINIKDIINWFQNFFCQKTSDAFVRTRRVMATGEVPFIASYPSLCVR